MHTLKTLKCRYISFPPTGYNTSCFCTPHHICGSSSKRSPSRVSLLLGKAPVEPVYAETDGNFVLRLPTKVRADMKALTHLC